MTDDTRPTALIAEDEPLMRERLKEKLAEVWPGLAVVAEAADGDEALALFDAEHPSIAFLDIRMPGRSGLDVAAAIGGECHIVFVTAYDQYALQAFDAQAADYLVKPVQRPRLRACIARLQQRLAAHAPTPGGGDGQDALAQTVRQLRSLLETMALPQAGEAQHLQVIQAQVGSVVHLVPIEQVLYFEAADKYVRVVTAEREHLIRLSLRELLPQLDPVRFWQVHRGTVVQARAIASARREDSGKLRLSLVGRTETLVASRLYAHRFKGM